MYFGIIVSFWQWQKPSHKHQKGESFYMDFRVRWIWSKSGGQIPVSPTLKTVNNINYNIYPTGYLKGYLSVLERLSWTK
jgi:hypothetical protein